MKSLISSEVTRGLLPFIYIFGFYVMIFGHLSPGGGFAGGSILGAGLILQHVMFRQDPHSKRLDSALLMKVLIFSLLAYGLIKCLHFFATPHSGGFHIPVGTAGTLFSGGTLMPLNILIGLVVAITFYFIAVMFEDGSLDNG